MKRRVILVGAVVLILIGILILIKLASASLSPVGKGALQITTNIKATVLLDNKSVGATPLCLCEQNQTVTAGKHDIKIVPDDKTMDPFSAKIDINPGVLTAVERTFLPGSLASSYTLTLEKSPKATPQILIASVPDGTLVSIDGNSVGATPYQDSLSASEHEVELEKAGFSKKTIRVRAVSSYRLVLNVVLGAQSDISDTVSPAQSPTPSISPTVVAQNTVTIKQTPTGFLNVRETASTVAKIVAKVNPGESYPFVDENESWYEIKLKDGTSGWISKTYAQKTSQ